MIGNCDGVHRGHQALIATAHKVANNHPVGVLTFSPHPSRILKNVPHFRLTSDDDKIEIFRKLKVDVAILHRINEQFLMISPADFVKDYLVQQLRVSHVVVGDDFTFGSGAQGDVARLLHWGGQFGFQTHVVKPIEVHLQRCSSTAIRNFLHAGKIEPATAMLGRPFCMAGPVIAGEKIGRMLGFATANINPPEGFGLKHGIYATVTRVGDEDFVSATSVGIRPTVSNEKKLLIETHLLDFDRDLYGLSLRIFFIEYLRPEEQFSSLEALREHIAQDCEHIRQIARRNPTRFQVKDWIN